MTDSASVSSVNLPAGPAPGNGKRRRALIGVAAVVVLLGGAWGLYEWLVASHYEDTDNAYVQGNVIQITPQIGGTVEAVMADDTDFVRAVRPRSGPDQAGSAAGIPSAPRSAFALQKTRPT